MDFIVELLMEIILDGTLEVSTMKSKKVPLVVRLLAGIVVLGLYGGLLMAFLYVGIHNQSPVFIGISLVLMIVIIAFFVKFYRTVKTKNNKEK